MPPELRFDIFSGANDKDAMWIESVEGFPKARERMEQIAAQAPGKYFVFSSHSRAVLLKIDTSRDFPSQSKVARKKASAQSA